MFSSKHVKGFVTPIYHVVSALQHRLIQVVTCLSITVTLTM
jgi:hypothetical protein